MGPRSLGIVMNLFLESPQSDGSNLFISLTSMLIITIKFAKITLVK